MQITHQLQHGSYHVTMRGSFTFSDHLAFRDILKEMATEGVNNVAFYLSEVEFVDSAALGMLLLARESAEKQHKNLTLHGATGQVKKMFDMSQFERLFTLR